MVRGHAATAWVLGALFVIALAVGAGAVGYVLGKDTGEARAETPGVYLDDEYTFLGAVRSWPAAPNSDATNPFPDYEDERLIALGRTVCIRAADPGMDFDGMLDLLELDPHQTFVVITEAIDKLCPSQDERLDELTS